MLIENSEARSPIATGPHRSRAARGLGKRGGSNPGIGPRRTRGIKAVIGIVGDGRRALRLRGRGALRRLESLGRPYWIILLSWPQGKSLGGALVPP